MENTQNKNQDKNITNALPKWEAPQLFIEDVEKSESGTNPGGAEGAFTPLFDFLYYS